MGAMENSQLRVLNLIGLSFFVFLLAQNARAADDENTTMSSEMRDEEVTSPKEFFPEESQVTEEDGVEVGLDGPESDLGLVQSVQPQSIYNQDPYPVSPDTTLTRKYPYYNNAYK
jgi:hypothetical protein